jgi:hypothetical protein
VENTEKEKGKPTPLQQLSRKLGRNTLVADTLVRLHHNGVKASPSMVYKVVAGEVYREDIATTFMQLAEEEIARRRQLDDRARQLIAEA